MFRRSCLIILCAVVAVICGQEMHNPSWRHNPQLGHQMVPQLTPDWNQQNFRQNNIFTDVNNDLDNVHESKVVVNGANEYNQVSMQPVARPQGSPTFSNIYSETQSDVVPQFYQKTFPSTNRYIQKSYQPFIEKISYRGYGKSSEPHPAAQELNPEYVPVPQWRNSQIYDLGHQQTSYPKSQGSFSPSSSSPQATHHAQYQVYDRSDISRRNPQTANFSPRQEWTRSAPAPQEQEWFVSDKSN